MGERTVAQSNPRSKISSKISKISKIPKISKISTISHDLSRPTLDVGPRGIYSVLVAITRVRDIMTDVVETLRVGDTLAMAREHLERGHIHHLPVIDDQEHVIGLITYNRILEAWISQSHPNIDSAAQIASDIPVDMLMEKDVLTVDADAAAAEAARLIETNRFGCLPVTTDEKLVGIITASDLVHLALRYLEQEL